MKTLMVGLALMGASLAFAGEPLPNASLSLYQEDGPVTTAEVSWATVPVRGYQYAEQVYTTPANRPAVVSEGFQYTITPLAQGGFQVDGQVRTVTGWDSQAVGRLPQISETPFSVVLPAADTSVGFLIQEKSYVLTLNVPSTFIPPPTL